MNLTAVQEVRNRSFAPLNECKSALEESNGDVEGAIVVLQKRGVLRAAASAAREAREGVVRSYVHNGKIAVLVEVNCETDFAARNPLFTQFVDDVAMHIAAANPLSLNREDVQKTSAFNTQRSIFDAEQEQLSNKPAQVRQKIWDGKWDKWYSEVCLIEQKSLVVEGSKTIEQLRAQLSSQLGENVVVRRFVRWELGS